MTIPFSKIVLNHVFNVADELQNEDLISLVKKVLSRISKYHDIYEMGFDYIRDGWTFAGKGGEVTEVGEIILDPKQILPLPEEVAMALIAHELAHFYLKHYLKPADGLKEEYEADDQARAWGFNVDEFRKVCGEPTLGKHQM
jgi:hypothetical protein